MAAHGSKSIIIVGAGINGISTAIWLQRAGHKVTIIDKEGPAAGTSYGNAGVLAAAAIIPVPVPGLLPKAPFLLLNKNYPLFLRWSYLPRLLPFLTKFLAGANDKTVRKTAPALGDLLLDTYEQHHALAKDTPAERYLHSGDYVFGYSDKASFDADGYGWSIRKELGVQYEEMDERTFGAFDPALKGCFGYGIRCPDHGRISDPGAYVKALVEHAVSEGAEFIIGNVTGLESHDGEHPSILVDGERLGGDEIIITAGIWSRSLTEQLGIKVPMEAERGYHLEFVNASVMPRCPVMVTTGKFVMTPMDGRLRCAGIVEFGGTTPKRSKPPLELLQRQTTDLLPQLTWDRVDEWMGFRPSTTDSLPMVGAVNGKPGFWTGFGHQHIGLTAGPKTGRWLAQLVDGQRPNIDLTPYDPNRFN